MLMLVIKFIGRHSKRSLRWSAHGIRGALSRLDPAPKSVPDSKANGTSFYPIYIDSGSYSSFTDSTRIKWAPLYISSIEFQELCEHSKNKFHSKSTCLNGVIYLFHQGRCWTQCSESASQKFDSVCRSRDGWRVLWKAKDFFVKMEWFELELFRGVLAPFFLFLYDGLSDCMVIRSCRLVLE